MDGPVKYRPMVIDDYEGAASLWRSDVGVQLRDSDSKTYVDGFLKRNLKTSFIAYIDERIIGVAMAGYDGRRGYLYHLAVDKDFRHRGVGKTLVGLVTDALEKVGMHKTLALVLQNNESAKEFWKALGWKTLEDLLVFERTTPGQPNA